MPVLLVTRPEPAASRTVKAVAALADSPFRVVRAPLMRIVPTGPAPSLDGFDRVIFTSANGVAAWCSAGGRSAGRTVPTGAAGGRQIRADVVGRRTSRAAREAGFTPGHVALDVDQLARLIAAEPDRLRLLHLRGEHSRGQLADRLRQAGHDVTEAIIYAQHLRPLEPEAAALAAGPTAVVVPLFSPRSAAHFARVWPAGPAPVLGAFLSPAVAAAAEAVPWRARLTADSPDLEAMARATSELLARAIRLEAPGPSA